MFNPEKKEAISMTREEETAYSNTIPRYILLKNKEGKSEEEALEIAAAEKGLNKEVFREFLASLSQRAEERTRKNTKEKRGGKRKHYTEEQVRAYQDSRPDLFD